MSQTGNKPSNKDKKKSQNVKCRSNCAAHKFSIKPKDEATYHQAQTINYCPQYSEKTYRYESIYPNLNIDGKKYFPLFCIDLDRDHYATHEEKFKEEHQKKVGDYIQHKTKIFQPKPGRKTQYCAVCKNQYDDYLDHINSDTHDKNTNSNLFIKEIKKISQGFSEIRKKEQLQYYQEDLAQTKEALSTTLEQDFESDIIFLGGEKENEKKKYMQMLYQQQTSTQNRFFQQQFQYQQSYGNQYTDSLVKSMMYQQMLFPNNFHQYQSYENQFNAQNFQNGVSSKTFNEQNNIKYSLDYENKLNHLCFYPTMVDQNQQQNQLLQSQITLQKTYPEESRIIPNTIRPLQASEIKQKSMNLAEIDSNLKRKRSPSINDNKDIQIPHFSETGYTTKVKKVKRIIDLTTHSNSDDKMGKKQDNQELENAKQNTNFHTQINQPQHTQINQN